MKQSNPQIAFKSLMAFALFLFMQTLAIAQGDAGSSTQVTKTSTSITNTWYAEPWVWVVAGAVFILLLVALMKGGSRTATNTERVSVTKTTGTDTV